LSSFAHRRKGLADLRFASPFFSKGLRPRDLRKFAVFVLSGNAYRIFRIGQPVDMNKLTSRPAASLGDKSDVAYLRQSSMLAVAGFNGIHFMKRNQHVCALQRRSTQVIAGVRGQVPSLWKPALQRSSIAFKRYHRSRGSNPV